MCGPQHRFMGCPGRMSRRGATLELTPRRDTGAGRVGGRHGLLNMVVTLEKKSGEPVIIALSRSGSLTPPDDFLVQPPNISRLYISSGQLLATSILVVAYQCPCGGKENLPPRGPSAGCIGVRGCRWVRDRRLSVDASLDTRIFTPHLHL